MRVVMAIWRAAIAEARARRGAFLFELTLMCINNMTWVFFWFVFFRQTGAVRGWSSSDTLLLFAVVCAVFGVANGLFRNARFLGEMANDGELDSALTLPVDPLLFLLIRRIDAFAIGDVVFGVVLFGIVGHPTPLRLALYALVVALGALVLVSFLVLLSASALRWGGGGKPARIGFDATALFAIYPLKYFDGVMKVVLLTVLPAGFVSAAPVGIIRSFSWSELAGLFVVACGFAIAARMAFSAALRSYRSGSQWTNA